MRTRNLSQLAALAFLTVILSACNANPVLGSAISASTQSANPSPVATQASPTPRSNLCANSLVPVKAGATWTYSSTGVMAEPVTFMTTITNVHPDGFTTATKLDDNNTVDQQWACKPDGIVALLVGSAQAAFGLSSQSVTVSLTTSNVTGVTIPADTHSGMQWNYGMDVSGSVTQGSLSVNLTGTVPTVLRATGTESVTVPAGTFNATKIQGTSTFNVTAEYFGLKLPVTGVVNSTFWFAPGVGWIKSIQTGNLPGTSFNSTTELQAYNIP